MTETPEPFVLLAARYARERPDEPAVTCGDRTLTWGDLDRRSTRIAHALASQGVSVGDLVTVALPNSIEMIEASIALWKVGATPQPVSARTPEAELRRIIALAGSPIVIASTADGSAEPLRVSVATLLQSMMNETPLPLRVSPAWKAPTSGGSTGLPKLIVSGEPATLSKDMCRLWRLGRGDVALMPGPLSHNAPFMTSALALFSGAELVLMPRFEPEEVLRLVEAHRATWLYLVPTMMHRIARLPAEVRARYDLSSLRTVWHMAAPCPPWLKEHWIDWLGADKVLELYAGTEAQAATVITGTEWLERRGSVGRAVVGEIKVVRADGSDASPGEVGDIYMRRPAGAGPSYRYVGASAEALGDGWETLGDIGWMDTDGYLYLADRRADMILVGGANIYPAEVEQVLDEHPSVLESAVIGLPDEDLGARLHAIIHASGSVTEGALVAHLAARLEPHKRPRSFEFVAEPLRDAAGKVRRSELRRLRVEAQSAEESVA